MTISKMYGTAVKFVNYRAPRYRSVLKHLSEAERYVDPTISDRELELNLHKRLMDLEAALIEEGQNILKPQLNESITSYSDRIKSYLEKSKDIKDSDLASYVFHRKVGRLFRNDYSRFLCRL